ncbi:PREDICTED: RAD51-associated protein 2 [Pseudopodoces humilis]|uniref:RAD51-associated protein 2 n=1 Tax=Pseudopodoces humilis TaxID=181119 RepID=UPI0006B6C3EA|nr:PREDICTED: RAD51-associated protein 2 [Pseudopodoces humilis]
MKSACSKRFLSASADETECYLYAKRSKAESDQKNREKEEQQKLEQNIHCGSKSQTSPHKLLYLSEEQNNWALEKQSYDTAKKTCMREFFNSKTCSNKVLAYRVSENEWPTKKWSPENEDQSPTEDGNSLNIHGQPLETELLNVLSPADACQNRNPPQVKQNNSIEQNYKRNEDNELKQNSSVTSLNRHMFQTELLSQKSVSNKKWQQYQLLQIPFLSGTNSLFSCIENKKSKFLKNCAEDKNYSSCNMETAAEKDNKEENNLLYVIPTLKPLKSIKALEIPDFQFPRISNKTNSKQSSTKFRETDWKNFEAEPSLIQSKQIHGVQEISEIGKQKIQNYKSSVRDSTVCSEFKVKNCPPINKQEHSALAEGEVSGTYFRCNSTDTECNKIFAEDDFKDKIMENSEGDDDQKSKIHIYISTKNAQKEKYISSNDLLQRRRRKSTNENVGTFNMQMSSPVTTEALEKNKLNLHCDVHDSNRDICLYKAKSKLSTKEILDFQSYVTKNITFKSNFPCIIVQDFPDKRTSCNVFRGKEMLFQNMLFGWVRMWTVSSHEDMPMCQDGSVTPWSHCCDTLKQQCDAQVLVKSTINRNQNDKIFMCLLAVVSKQLKVEVLKIMLASFFSSINTLSAAERKSMRGEKWSLCGRKQSQLNSCTDDSLSQTTGFLKENETYPGLVSSKFVESIDFELYNGCQRRCISRTLGEEYTFLQRGARFHNRKQRLCKGRRVRKHYLLSRVNGRFSTDLRSVSHKNSMKKQILPAKCLILLQGSSDSSSLHKIYCCNITKVQYLIGANLRYQSYFPALSPPKLEKVHKKSTIQEVSVNTLNQEKNKPSIRLNSSFHAGLFKDIPFVLYENKNHKATGYRNCITSTNEVINEVAYTMNKYLGNSSYINADGKEYVNSKELQMNCHDLLSKKSFSVFDTYEKIPLATDSEDFDQIPVVKQDSSIQKKLCEESAVNGSKEIHCLPVKSNVLIPSEQPKATTEEYNSLQLLDRQINKHENCKDLDTCSLHLVNKKVHDQNTYLFSENLFPSSSNIFQSVTLPLDSSSFVNREISEDGHCRNSSGTDKQKAGETIPARVQHLTKGSSAMTDTYLQLQAKEAVQFSLQGHEQTNMTVSSEPATLKQHLEYVKEQEERNYEQMHVTNESQCETVMNYLIMLHSEDKSKTFISAEKELKMSLSIMNNGCLEDVKDKYLPLENKITQEFELKRKFDLVLEELRMFHEISKENVNNLSSLETNLPNSYRELNNAEGIDKNMAGVSQRKTCISSSICGTKGKHIADINESSFHEKILNENKEQKVSTEYSISRMSSEELLHSPAEGAAYRNPYTWDLAFLPSMLFKEQSYNLQKEGGYFLSRDVIRVQPLKTCKGPIRIGLSRKAQLKKLHPYLK